MPGESLRTVFNTLRDPLRQMLRLPETNWAARTAKLLEKAEVCTAEEYMNLVSRPSEFKSFVNFPLPDTTLEGYLYPDTYDLPPMLGARAVVEKQLLAFENKIWEPMGRPAGLARLTIFRH